MAQYGIAVANQPCNYELEMPNILLILTDQQRWDSLGCYGATWVDTPNLDRLAADGVRFDRCYCTNAICTPSRASLWTGKHLPGHGVYRLDDILPRDEVLFTEHLRKAGYRTGLFGKLHVSGRKFEDEKRHPGDGFDEYKWALEGPLNMDAPMQAYSRWLEEKDPAMHKKMKKLGRDLHHPPRNIHFTRWAAEGAIGFINENAGIRPFFCCMSVFDPHNPYEGYPIEYADRVYPSRFPDTIIDEHDDAPMHVHREREHSYLGDVDAFAADDVMRMRTGYHASIALIDDEVGRVLEALEDSGTAEDTLVIFASDHGDMLGDHRLLVKGAMFYDGCIRVPLILRWPRALPKALAIPSPVQLHDIAATVLSAAGIDLPWNESEEAICGRDLSPLIRGEISRVREDTVNLYRNSGINRTSRDWDPPLNASMILDERYKLSLYHGDHNDHPAGDLYDLVKDPFERNNLWLDTGSATVRAHLMQRLLDWMVKNEIAYLGSRGGTAVVKPEEFISNTIDPNRS